MKNLHILPTDKPSRLIQAEDDELMLLNELYENTYNINKHIYITSDEKIKKGNYWIYVCPINGIDYGDDNNPIVKNNLNSTWFEKLHDKNNYKKVILTTDSDLIQDGVQEIDKEFLEWFVKNHTCKFVEVKQLLSNNGNAFFGYKIITPKEKQKQLLSEMMQEDEKSGLYDETLEEARDAYNVSQERIYSKEEVLEIIDSLFHRYASSFRIDAKEYFLQFKKK